MAAVPRRGYRAAYLLWSPGFAGSLATSAVIELMLLFAIRYQPVLQAYSEDTIAAVQLALLDGAHALHWWSAIAMLASACCVIQIMLTALSVGCSGLNALLGPVRPPLLIATLLLQTGNWYTVVTKKPENARLVALGTAISLLVSFSPEITELIARWRSRPLQQRTAEGGTEVTLKVAKVSCSVCEAKVRSVAEAHASVLRCDVDIDRSLATLSIAAAGASAIAAVTAEVTASLEAAGYPLKNDCREADLDQVKCERPERKVVGGMRDAQVGAVLGGLLGSSCCAVQLTINALAPLGINLLAPLGLQGCAGFNTYLGPLRPYTRGATATFLALRWASARNKSKQRRVLLLSTVLAAGLTYMPEMLLLAGATAIAPPTDGAYYIDVPIGSMGCEACQHQVRSVMLGSSGVVDARVMGTDEDGIARMLVQVCVQATSPPLGSPPYSSPPPRAAPLQLHPAARPSQPIPVPFQPSPNASHPATITSPRPAALGPRPRLHRQTSERIGIRDGRGSCQGGGRRRAVAPVVFTHVVLSRITWVCSLVWGSGSSRCGTAMSYSHSYETAWYPNAGSSSS